MSRMQVMLTAPRRSRCVTYGGHFYGLSYGLTSESAFGRQDIGNGVPAIGNRDSSTAHIQVFSTRFCPPRPNNINAACGSMQVILVGSLGCPVCLAMDDLCMALTRSHPVSVRIFSESRLTFANGRSLAERGQMTNDPRRSDVMV